MITINNGWEFDTAAFQDMLKQRGIAEWRTQPCTPSQNEKMEPCAALKGRTVHRKRIDIAV
jgi:transposase InsO family protein